MVRKDGGGAGVFTVIIEEELAEFDGGETLDGVIGEDGLGVADVTAERIWVEVFNIIIIGDFFKLLLATADGVVDVAKDKAKGNRDDRNADHREETDFAPGEGGAGGFRLASG